MYKYIIFLDSWLPEHHYCIFISKILSSPTFPFQQFYPRQLFPKLDFFLPTLLNKPCTLYFPICHSPFPLGAEYGSLVRLTLGSDSRRSAYLDSVSGLAAVSHIPILQPE